MLHRGLSCQPCGTDEEATDEEEMDEEATDEEATLVHTSRSQLGSSSSPPIGLATFMS